MRYLAVTLALACAAGAFGCGGQDLPSAAAPARRAAPATARARTLVSCQRNGGLAATLDRLVVRTDGTAVLDKRYGGAGRRKSSFRVRPATLTRLRAALAALPRRLPERSGGVADGYTFLLSYRGRTLAAHEGALPRRGGRAFTILGALIDGDGRA